MLHIPHSLSVALFAVAMSAHATSQNRRHDSGGDIDKIEWVRPFAAAQERARELGRVLLVKPIMGGSNKPNPDGLPCGGVDDCEGSW